MKNIEICVRAIIQSRGKILVCWHKEKEYYFFPGGHIDFGERAEPALIRELKEELDIVVERFSFIGVAENIYKEEKDKHREHRGKHHEINLVFNVKAKKVRDKSKEDHIDFFFLDIKKFSKTNVFPTVLKDSVIQWLKDGNNFWVSQN
jgi:8-oxo-dGTP diphosphatase